MGIRSTNGVNDHLRALERKGYLTREDMKSRALKPRPRRLAPPANKLNADDDLIEVRVLGASQQACRSTQKRRDRRPCASTACWCERPRGVRPARHGDSMIDAAF